MTGRRHLGAPTLALAALAVIAYLPPMWSAPGRVGADTKTYLYLDPARLLARAPYLWDRHIGFGTVTHQTIGYLWPMGPWYWALERLGLPDWVAQRLWLGTLIFAAAAGVWFLLRVIEPASGWGAPARFVAALAYGLSPYLLDYAARISAILLPWAALPWMIAAVVLAVRRGGWRWPGVFALIVATVGGVNATALLLAGLGPLVWLVALVVLERVPARRAAAVAGRIGVLSAVVSLWWVAGLWAQGRYGVPILRYTETYETVASTATAPELARGLGYWFFYGSDKLGPWIEAGAQYTHPALVALGYGLVAAALVSAALVRWRHRRVAMALVVVGLVVAVGAHPYDGAGQTLYGRGWKALSTTTIGGALRSTPRAVPLVVLGLALLLGAGVDALARRAAAAPGRRPAWRLLPAGVAVVAIGLNQLPLFTGSLYGDNLQRPEEVPAYWTEAAAALDAGDASTRVLEVPGIDFASYRWGNTVDPITPGLTDRPYVARELIPYGSPPSTDLLVALDRRMQEGVFEPASLAPIARLASVGTVALRADLQYERFRTPRPRRSAVELAAAPGLGEPVGFGPAEPNRAIDRLPLIDEIELGIRPGAPYPSPVELYPVEDATPIVHATATAAPVVYAGGADGLIDAAAAGLLDDPGVLLASGGVAGRPEVLETALSADAHLLLTDTNQRRAHRWGSVRENLGYVEAAGEEPLVDDPSDNRLDLYPDASGDGDPDGDHARTVTELGGLGVASVRATRYGNPVSYTAEDRPAGALDGDALTAWRVGAFADVRGERIEIGFDGPVTTDEVRLLQPVNGPRNRWMTRVRLRFDAGDPLDVVLDDTSRSEPGQVIALGWERTFESLSVEVLDSNLAPTPLYDGLSGVGIAELDVAGRRVDEVLRLPLDLLGAPGAASSDHRLSVVATRWRADPAEPVRRDPETHLARRFTLPAERTFALGGTARAAVPLTAEPEAIVASATGSLAGDLRAGPRAAIDGDPATAWTTPFVGVEGNAATYALPAPLTVEHLDLVVLDDGRHSRPTEITVSADGGPPVSAPVPTGGGRVALPVPVMGSSITITITAIEPVEVIDYYSEIPVATPVAIVEWGIPGLAVPPIDDATALPGTCRDDLVRIDGVAVAVRVSGTVGAALDRDGLALEPCGAAVTLGPGTHELRTALGRDTGIDVDRIVLDAAGAPTVATAGPAPVLTVADEGPVSYDVRATGADGPFWVVLGQSHNDGWRLHVEGLGDQGPPVLVDGYANGWLVTPPAGGDELTLSLRWTPQRVVWAALALSALGAIACLALALWPRRRRGRDLVDPEPATRGPRTSWLGPVAVAVGFGVVAGPLVGVGAGVTSALVRRRPTAGRWLAWAPPVLMATCALWVAALTLRYDLPAGFEWPTYFDATHQLGWLAVAVAAVLAWRPTAPAPDVDAGADAVGHQLVSSGRPSS